MFFFHFRENNDKVPESSKNGPKKVPILPLRPEFCLCKDFLSQVPNPIFFFGAPAKAPRGNDVTPTACSTFLEIQHVEKRLKEAKRNFQDF